ncbi:Flp pilus assembly protein CpaB [Clostridium sp. DJ247]|uniref:Flp pilus assembly protein CpaB n=1 Tax=Clostridium sp. DJ247 TaxID=2726188 RepID=UPI001623CD59|nr:RcpC/CpaB family pilus assembly protein [Clostridium sp. DJ247]MBC2579393.1 pilus assembly protein CpaB [Clostridium sp. DJ247]
MKNLFKNRTVVGLTAIVLSLLICFGVTPLFNNALQSKISVVRIVKDVKAGEKITADKIQVVEIGGYNLPTTVLKNKENVVGKYATADLFKGDYVLNSKVSTNPLAENKYLYGLDGNKQAISISIKSFAAGLSGKLQTGDIISIIACNFGELRETIIPNELQYIRVLAVTTDKGADKQYTDNKKDDKEQELPSTVTLLVNKAQAKLLAELEEKSKMHVSLIYRGNEETAQKFIDEQEKVIKDSSGNATSNAEVNVIKQAQGGI